MGRYGEPCEAGEVSQNTIQLSASRKDPLYWGVGSVVHDAFRRSNKQPLSKVQTGMALVINSILRESNITFGPAWNPVPFLCGDM